MDGGFPIEFPEYADREVAYMFPYTFYHGKTLIAGICMELEAKEIIKESGGNMSPVLEEVIEYLESYNVKPTKKKISEELNFYIKNLYSHVGEAAHKHEGIINDTDMTWEEMDAQMLKQIDGYKEALKELEFVEL